MAMLEDFAVTFATPCRVTLILYPNVEVGPPTTPALYPRCLDICTGSGGDSNRNTESIPYIS